MNLISLQRNFLLMVSENRSKADSVVVGGNGHMLLGQETAEVLNLSHIGPKLDVRENTSTHLLVLVF